MFRYLTRDVPKNHADMDLIHDFAKTAANSYLGPSKTPLNFSIEKIASSSHLSPDQVNMLCQEANKEVHAALFDRSENKYTDFDLADSSQVLHALNGGQVKTASSNFFENDYGLSPSEQREAPDFIVARATGHDGMRDMSKFQKQASFEKLSYELDNALKDRVLLEDQMSYLEKKFIKTARAHLTQYPLHARADQYPYIAMFNKQAGLSSDDNTNLMKMLNYVMVSQGLMEKNAEVPVDDDLIDYDLNARIINGDHPLEAIVKTIVDNRKNRDILTDRVNVIQDTLNGHGAVQGYKRVSNL